MNSNILEKILSVRLEEHKKHILDELYGIELNNYAKSPIEEILLLALMTKKWGFWGLSTDTETYVRSVSVHSLQTRYPSISSVDRENGTQVMEWKCVFIIPQYPIGKYKTDFGIFVGDSDGFAKIAIECDGHDFHEKTKDQVARDKKRDRFFNSNGWRLLRFSGHEIYSDPTKVADEVIKFVGDVYFYDVTGYPRPQV